MPYELKKVSGGYKIRKKDGLPMRNGRMYTSDKPMTYENAKKQLAALYASYNNETKYKIYKFDATVTSISDNIVANGGGGKYVYKIGRRDGKKLDNGRYYTTNKYITTYKEALSKLKKIKKYYRNNTSAE